MLTIITTLNHDTWKLWLNYHPDAACANYILDGITNGFRIGFSHTDHVHVHLLSATTSQTGRHRVCSMLAIFNQPCQKNRSHIHISTLPICRLLSSRISSSVPSILEHFMSVCWLPLCQFAGFLGQQNLKHQIIPALVKFVLLSYCAIDCSQSPSFVTCPGCSYICPVRGKVC